MAQLWHNEVCRKFKVQNRFKLQVQISKLGPLDAGGKNSRLATQVDSPVDWAVDLARTKSTALSTWVSIGGARPVWPGAPF